MVREDSLITVGQVKVFWQTACRTAVFNSSVRGKKSEKSTQADQSLALSLPAFGYTLSNLCNVKILLFIVRRVAVLPEQNRNIHNPKCNKHKGFLLFFLSVIFILNYNEK